MVGTSGNSNDNNLLNHQNIVPTPSPTQPISPLSTNIPPTPPLPNSLENDMPVSENPEDLDTRWTRWRCLVCNYTYEGREPLKKCPRCGNEDPDKFNDVD